MENKRNIAISLQEAREWYKSGNSALKEIALKAYSEKELIANYDFIEPQVDTYCIGFDIPKDEPYKWEILSRLAVIAKYYNGSWVMEAGKTGYFIGRTSSDKSIKPYHRISSDIAIFKHDTVQYAGVVYFNDLQGAIEAVAILGDNLDMLF